MRPDPLLRLLLYACFVAATFHATSTDWPALSHIEVKGEMRLTENEVISLASLDDTSGVWVPFIRRDAIRRSLEGHPLIDHAEISITSPRSIRVNITERKGVGAIEQNGFRLVFDRTGELIEIKHPAQIYTGHVVQNVPPGLLRLGGVPIHGRSEAWHLTGAFLKSGLELEYFDRQFNRLIHLVHLLAFYGTEYENELTGIRMDNRGRLHVGYVGRPSVLLGRFDSPDEQFGRLLAVLGDERFADPEKISCIDLSSLKFPHYHVGEEYFTPAERRAIEAWQNESESNEEIPSDAETMLGEM